MKENFNELQELLRNKAELSSRLGLLPYDGTPEIKEINGKKYLYIRKRVLNRVKSEYVGTYSDELYSFLIKTVKEAKTIRKEIKKIEKRLAIIGYSEGELSSNVMLNLDFARKNMKAIIYDQAILEGVATTFPDTETIIDNGKVNNMTATDVQKILNLKHAWEFILDKDVISAKSDYYISSYIAKLVNEGFYYEGGKIRSLPVTIGGSSYLPPIPLELDVKDGINQILNSDLEPIDIAIELCLYVMKTQIYIDGNKRTAVIFANHYLISSGLGLLVIPANEVSDFKKMLILYYEDKSIEVKEFLKKHIIKMN